MTVKFLSLQKLDSMRMIYKFLLIGFIIIPLELKSQKDRINVDFNSDK